LKNQRRVASNDDQLSEFLFGAVRPWWDRRPWLRRLFLVPLRSVDKSYGRWSKARVSPRRFRKIQSASTENIHRTSSPLQISSAGTESSTSYSTLSDSTYCGIPHLPSILAEKSCPKRSVSQETAEQARPSSLWSRCERCS